MTSPSSTPMSNVAPDSRAILATVPQEIFDNIIDCLGSLARTRYYNELLRLLRLVSRGINIKVLSHFARHHLGGIQVALFDRDSLLNALKIAAHPAYGAAVRHVSFDLDELSDAPSSVPKGSLESHQRNEDMASWDLLREEQQSLRESGDDLKHLALMLCHLRRHDKIESIGLYNGSEYDLFPWATPH